MRFENHLMKTQTFLENLGCLRISAFYSLQSKDQGNQVQKIVRLAVCLLAFGALYDRFNDSFPFKVKIAVYSPLLGLVSCVVLSLLLKGAVKGAQSLEKLGKFKMETVFRRRFTYKEKVGEIKGFSTPKQLSSEGVLRVSKWLSNNKMEVEAYPMRHVAPSPPEIHIEIDSDESNPFGKEDVLKKTFPTKTPKPLNRRCRTVKKRNLIPVFQKLSS